LKSEAYALKTATFQSINYRSVDYVLSSAAPNLFQKKCESRTDQYKRAAVFRPPLLLRASQSNFP